MNMSQPPTTAMLATAGRACLAASAALLWWIAACTTHGPSQQDEALVREFAAKGYASTEQDPFATETTTWMQSAGQFVSVVVVRPTRAGTTPIVIYLPGLGESSESGERWHAAWAAAGYAVVSVQLMDEDANAFRSELARSGEFKALGRQHYSAGAVHRRTQLLADLVAEGRRRTGAGQAHWQQLDWNKMAVAGFDLGAYTVMAAAGEQVRDTDDLASRLQIRAAIALSPYASIAEGASDDRYRNIRAPVMSITSDLDIDPLGLVEGAYVRGAPFSHMLGPDKYLLSLRGLPHAGLSGNAAAEIRSSAHASKRPQGSGGDDAGQTRRSSRRGGGGGTGTGNDVGSGRDRSAAAGDGAGNGNLTTSELQMRVIAAQQVSTAFLDAYVKDDPLAREWLAADAGRWLGAAGQLRRK
jgi:dienelactone hydrolase